MGTFKRWFSLGQSTVSGIIRTETWSWLLLTCNHKELSLTSYIIHVTSLRVSFFIGKSVGGGIWNILRFFPTSGIWWFHRLWLYIERERFVSTVLSGKIQKFDFLLPCIFIFCLLSHYFDPNVKGKWEKAIFPMCI